MTKYGVVTSYTTSLSVVANDIAYALRKHNHKVIVWNKIVYPHIARKFIDRGIVFIPFDPLYAHVWFLLQRDYKLSNIPSVTYVTTEGKPKRYLIKDWIRRDCNFVANSRFTREMLESVDIFVEGVIYHGINLDMIDEVRRSAEKRREQLKSMLGVKTVFGTVCSDHPRKGLDYLKQVIENATEKSEDIGFVVITKLGGAKTLQGLKNTHVIPRFGKMTRPEILSYIGAFDYYLNPTLAEGFGLPLLEANAFGVPCIFPNYRPLNEIIVPEHNIPVDIIEENYVDFGDGIMYYTHYYSVDEMAQKVLEAHDIHMNEEEYRKMSETIKKDAERFDINKTYKAFADGWRW